MTEMVRGDLFSGVLVIGIATGIVMLSVSNLCADTSINFEGVSWYSGFLHRKCVAASSTELEYIAFSKCIQNIRYYWGILKEFGEVIWPTIVYKDNEASFCGQLTQRYTTITSKYIPMCFRKLLVMAKWNYRTVHQQKWREILYRSHWERGSSRPWTPRFQFCFHSMKTCNHECTFPRGRELIHRFSTTRGEVKLYISFRDLYANLN